MKETGLYAFSSIREFEKDGDFDRWYIPARGLVAALDNPENRVLMPDVGVMRQYVQQFGQILQELNISAPQPTFIPDAHYLMDTSIRDNIELVQRTLLMEQLYRVYPYSNTEDLRQWMGLLTKQGYNLELHMPERVYFDNLRHPQHRGGWAQHVGDERPSLPKEYGIPYPEAWCGQGLEQILEAYRNVTEKTGDTRAYLKPVFSSGGFALRLAESESDVVNIYNELEQSGLLDLFGQTMPIEVQEYLDIVEIFSIQYDGDINISPNGLTRQIEQNHKWQGNIFNSNHIMPEIRAVAAECFTRFTKAYHRELGVPLSGFGGLDLALVRRNNRLELLVLESNGGREVGARPGIVVADVLGIRNQPSLMRKVGAEPEADLTTVWRALKKMGLAFQDDPYHKRGVMPMVYLPGSIFLLATGEDMVDHHNLLKMSDDAIKAISDEGLVKLAV